MALPYLRTGCVCVQFILHLLPGQPTSTTRHRSEWVHIQPGSCECARLQWRPFQLRTPRSAGPGKREDSIHSRHEQQAGCSGHGLPVASRVLHIGLLTGPGPTCWGRSSGRGLSARIGRRGAAGADRPTRISVRRLRPAQVGDAGRRGQAALRLAPESAGTGGRQRLA
jgi:hypothetical protein